MSFAPVQIPYPTLVASTPKCPPFSPFVSSRARDEAENFCVQLEQGKVREMEEQLSKLHLDEQTKDLSYKNQQPKMCSREAPAVTKNGFLNTPAYTRFRELEKLMSNDLIMCEPLKNTQEQFEDLENRWGFLEHFRTFVLVELERTVDQ